MVAIGLLALCTVRTFADQPTDSASKAAFVLKIQKATAVKDEAHFVQTLKKLKSQLYDIDIEDEKGNHKKVVPDSNAKIDIKTDKVTTSAAAQSKAGEPTYIQTRTTIQVPSNYVSDIQAVLAELQ